MSSFRTFIIRVYLFNVCFPCLSVNSIKADNMGTLFTSVAPPPSKRPDPINQEVLSFQINEKCTSVVNGRRGAGQGKIEEIYRN